MQWLRLRPQTPEELDMVDWRGRWIDDEEYGDVDEEEEEADKQMEDFDPVRPFKIRIDPCSRMESTLGRCG